MKKARSTHLPDVMHNAASTIKSFQVLSTAAAITSCQVAANHSATSDAIFVIYDA